MSSYQPLPFKDPIVQCSQIQVYINATNSNDIIFMDSNGTQISPEHVTGLLIYALKESYLKFEHVKKGIQAASYNHLTNNND